MLHRPQRSRERGPDHRADGEGGHNGDTAGYRDLHSDDRARAYHPTLHTRRHFDHVAELLEPATGANWSCDRDDALKALRRLRGELMENQAPFRPGDTTPLSPED